MGRVKEKIEAFSLKRVISYLDKDPDENIPKVIDWVEKFDRDHEYATPYRLAKEALRDPENNWNKLMKSLYSDIDEGVRKKLFENFIINALILRNERRKEIEKKYNCNVPWTLLLDPTSACNLHCTGCWAAEYGDTLSLSFEALDDIIHQAKEIGMHMFIFTGGEPLVRKKDVIRLCEKHNDCVFSAFTNGTLIDEAFADEMLRVKNFIPAISVEGFEEETDMRRGKGTYGAVIRAMDLLREKKLPFGFSACYHRKNTDVIASEAYFDEMIAKGCKFAWIFTYMPVGKDAVPDLIATAEQRETMYRQIRKFRKEKPIFTMDFWNDGEYVGGCIAGGRCYLHINAAGDIEPCAFIHYADSNIKEKTLLEALQSPLFMQYRKNQPFNENLLRPCPLLDNPGRLAEMVKESGANSTDFQHPEDVTELSERCVEAANLWAPVADKLWETRQKNKNL
ncbi:radical SAM protein [Sinanaerobacter chloroacetimidivorans]|uniref:Radical SAM protein n=1 Tax=Sinanaerobacter chloroacetimidivorans TaxID=2818044 RepID=A0A8J7W1F6_9FIRM|nr:radical SAM protein [Sinanaerobacter chloroacetimidivorans]MBR0597823.1 radical SAM protein [Sinanaerobacter chloroacetimidivorans]